MDFLSNVDWKATGVGVSLILGVCLLFKDTAIEKFKAFQASRKTLSKASGLPQDATEAPGKGSDTPDLSGVIHTLLEVRAYLTRHEIEAHVPLNTLLMAVIEHPYKGEAKHE